MTFRLRTALAVLVLTAGTMGAAFFLVWGTFVASQRHQLDVALLDVAEREVAEARAGALELTDAPGPSANAVGPLPKYGVMYDAAGKVLSTTNNFKHVPPLPARSPSKAAFDFEHDDHPMRGVVLDVGGQGPAQRLFLATTRDDLEDDGRILGRGMSVAWLVGCMWAATVAFGVASRLTAQHQVVADVARRVASGDTSARVAFRTTDADLRQLARDLNAMIDRLVGLVASQERFVSHAAHELRTPLTSLRLEIELALRTCDTREAYAEALTGALGSSKRLSALADDLLELARADADAVGEDVALEVAVDDACAVVAPLAREKDVRLSIVQPNLHVQGTRSSLARVLRNVLENAVRFSPNGGAVELRAEERDGRVTIVVTDEGPGISAADAERIFEPFVRGAARDGSDPGGDTHAGSASDGGHGAGLGLAIARELVRAMGGDVRAVSRAAGEIVVVLPAAAAR